MTNKKLEQEIIETDLCVIGGGMAGIATAITAARLGVRTVLIHERPVVGGNASGEIRMWICGVKDFEYRETGLLEEIALENYSLNPTKNFFLWDSILYGKVCNQKNLTTFLNCTCFDADTKERTIQSITAYQMTTQQFVRVKAKYYADCSGDSILAPLTGADFMYGRESVDEYGETMMRTHVESDEKTMGNSCLIQARKTNRKVEFHAPEWAEKISVEKLKERYVDIHEPYENFWYIEIGGIGDVIKDAERLNRRLIAICLGVWDTIKNSGEFDADEFELEFIGFLGAKRESRRMSGDYVMTANDIVASKIFADEVAYGGWPLDDHFPEGFDGTTGNYTINVKPYGIPYRCLYSKNINNLFFAGRNISLTHMAMSSARVMGTCTTLGQAVGVAAYYAMKNGVFPRAVGEKYIREVQQTLLKLDCYLPNVEREVNVINQKTKNGCGILQNGKDRDLKGVCNGEVLQNGKDVTLEFDEPTYVGEVKIVFDSDLMRSTFDCCYAEKEHIMRCNVLDDSPVMHMPKSLAKDFSLIALCANGQKKIFDFKKNLLRNVIVSVGESIKSISLRISENWGDTDTTKVFTFEIL